MYTVKKKHLIIPALRRQGLSGTQTSSRIIKPIQRNPVSKTNQKYM